MAGGQAAAEHPFDVLLVEDDATTRAFLSREIAEAGHPVRAAADGTDAMAALAIHPAAIVVADIVLPGRLDGLQLCRAVKEEHPDCELVLLTGQASIAFAIEGVRLGACDFLLKPIEPGSLAQAVARASARIARRLGERQVVAGLRARSDGQAALLDRLTVAVILADADGRVHGRNRASEPLFTAGGLAIGPDGRLCAARIEETSALRQALATACRGGGAEHSAVSLSRGGGRPGVRAVVTSLRAGADGAREPLASVLVDLPERSAVQPNAEMLSHLYGLTPAEGQFAARLVAGDTVQEACEAVGVALATGRTHLSRIFGKTGTSRQADLIGLVLCGPALLAGAAPRGTRSSP